MLSVRRISLGGAGMERQTLPEGRIEGCTKWDAPERQG